MSTRQNIFRYVKKKYGVLPDYPFPNAKSFPVLRHADNRKWFALIMDVPREKLGLDGAERVDVINLKLGDPFFIDSLIQKPGYFIGYHISGGGWVSVLLDGTVELKEIYALIDESFLRTAAKQKKQPRRPKKNEV
ncbi:MAG: MmcQ/YjbR family DNA-binding protein [Clostridia bacterium]|nr:MmcQ/YjbR family DNA-binding protein [Clostridia bacterium]